MLVGADLERTRYPRQPRWRILVDEVSISRIGSDPDLEPGVVALFGNRQRPLRCHPRRGDVGLLEIHHPAIAREEERGFFRSVGNQAQCLEKQLSLAGRLAQPRVVRQKCDLDRPGHIPGLHVVLTGSPEVRNGLVHASER